MFQQVPPRAIGAGEDESPAGDARRLRVGARCGIITESTYGANPATSYIIVPIGNPGTGAGQIQMSILGRNIDKEGQVAVPKVTIPPIPVPSFGAVCFTQNGPRHGHGRLRRRRRRGGSPTCSTTAPCRIT